MTRFDDWLNNDPQFLAEDFETRETLRQYFYAKPAEFKNYLATHPEVINEDAQTQEDIINYHTRVGVFDRPHAPSAIEELLTIGDTNLIDETIRPLHSALGQAEQTAAGYALVLGDKLDSPWLTEVADEWYEIGEQRHRASRIGVEDPFYQYGQDVASSLTVQAPGIALSVATGNPAPQMLYMGALKFGKEYYDLRRAGYSPNHAMAWAGTLSAVEGALEKIGTGSLLNKGKTGLKKILHTAIEEAGEEGLQNISDFAVKRLADGIYDRATHDPLVANKTAMEVVRETAYSMAVGFGAGGVQAKVMNSIQDYQLDSAGLELVQVNEDVWVPMKKGIPETLKQMKLAELQELNPRTEKELDAAVDTINERHRVRNEFREEVEEIRKEVYTVPIEEQVDALLSNRAPIPSTMAPGKVALERQPPTRPIVRKDQAGRTDLAHWAAEGLTNAYYRGVELMESGVRDFAAWSRRMVHEFGAAIKAKLAEIWHSVTNQSRRGVLIGRNANTMQFIPDHRKWQGPEGKVRAEITDHLAHVVMDVPNLRQRVGQPMKLEDVLHHRSAYAAYPDLRNVEFTLMPSDGSDIAARFIPGETRLPKGATSPVIIPPRIEIYDDPRLTEDKIFEALIHEIQHFIQRKEGWARGARASDVHYDDSAGEAEAQEAAARRHLNVQQRDQNRFKRITADEYTVKVGENDWYAMKKSDFQTKPLYKGQRVALKAKQVGGPQTNVPLNGEIVGLREVNGVQIADVLLDDSDVVSRGLVKGDLMPSSDPGVLGGDSAVMENIGVIALMRRLMAMFPQQIKRLPAVKRTMGKLLSKMSRDGLEAKFEVVWDAGSLPARWLAHNIGSFIRTLPGKSETDTDGVLPILHSLDSKIRSELSVEKLMDSLTYSLGEKRVPKLEQFKKAENPEEAHHRALLRAYFNADLADVARQWNPYFTEGQDDTIEALIDTAISIIINDNGGSALKGTAFEDIYNSWVDANPGSVKVLGRLREIVEHGGSLTQAEKDIMEMLDRGSKLVTAGRLEVEAKKPSGWQILKMLVSDENSGLYDIIARYTDEATLLRVKNIIERKGRSSGEGQFYGDEVMNKVMDPVREAGISHEDFRYFNFLMRIGAGERVRVAQFLANSDAQAKVHIKEAIEEAMPDATRGQKAGMAREMFEGWKAKNTFTKIIELQNPGGVLQESARSLLDQLEARVGPDKFAVMARVRKIWSDLRQELIINKLKGDPTIPPLVSDRMLETINNADNYVAFSVAAYMGEQFNGQAGSALHQQFGTYMDIADPIASTIMKDFYLIRWANQERAKIAAVDVLKEINGLLPEGVDPVITPLERNKNGDFPIAAGEFRTLIIRRRDPLTGDIKREGYRVSRLTAAGILDDHGGWQMLNDLNKMGVGGVSLQSTGSFSRGAFTVYNPGFWLMNIVRDYERAVVNLPGLVSPLSFTGHFLTSLPDAVKAAMGVYTDDMTDLREAAKKGLLGGGLAFHKDAETEEFDRINAALMSRPESWKKVLTEWTDFHDFVGGALQWGKATMQGLGRASELATKVAAVRYFNSLPDSEMSQDLKEWYIKKAIGSPDFWTKGAASPLLSNTFLFLNPMVQSWKTDIEILTTKSRAPVSVGVKRLLASLLNKAILIFLATRMGDDWKEAMRRIPMHDWTHYNIIPAGMQPDGKLGYWKLPQDPTTQAFSSVFALVGRSIIDPTIDPVSDLIGLRGAFTRFMTDQVPSVNPFVQSLGDLVDYAAGRNPYDPWRQTNVLSRLEQETRAVAPGAARMEMAKHLLDQVGIIAPIYRFKHSGKEGITNELEKELGLFRPVLQPIMNRFFAVTDRGLVEEKQRELRKTRAEKAMGSRLRQEITDWPSHGIDKILWGIARGERFDQAHLDAAKGEHRDRLVKILENNRRMVGEATSDRERQLLQSEARAILKAGRSKEERDQLIINFINRRKSKGGSK